MSNPLQRMVENMRKNMSEADKFFEETVNKNSVMLDKVQLYRKVQDKDVEYAVYEVYLFRRVHQVPLHATLEESVEVDDNLKLAFGSLNATWCYNFEKYFKNTVQSLGEGDSYLDAGQKIFVKGKDMQRILEKALKQEIEYFGVKGVPTNE